MSIYVDIRKKLGSFSLEARFEAKDETLALLGASGCGKSLTLKCVAGVEKPDSGVILVNGRTFFDSEKGVNLPPQKRKVGMLFQNCSLFPNMTVKENILAVLTHAKNNACADARLRSLIKRFYLESLENHYPCQLSGGQQQRAALARMMGREPEIIMLDEPFSALDSYLRWQLELELMKTLDGFRGTAILVSHNRDEVYRLCDKVCPMENGGAKKIYGKKELFDNPGTLAECMLSGCKNYSGIKKTGEKSVYAIDWETELKCAAPVPENAVFIGVRAHYVTPARDGESDNIVPCRVSRVIDNLFSVIIMMSPRGIEQRGGYRGIRMELSRQEAEGIKTGDLINIYIDPKNIILLSE